MADEQLAQIAKVVLQALGRGPLPEDHVRELVTSRTPKRKHVQAYNLCDGTRTEKQIAKEAGLPEDRFSSSVARWVNAGIVFRGVGGPDRLLHIYPIEAAARKRDAAKDA